MHPQALHGRCTGKVGSELARGILLQAGKQGEQFLAAGFEHGAHGPLIHPVDETVDRQHEGDEKRKKPKPDQNCHQFCPDDVPGNVGEENEHRNDEGQQVPPGNVAQEPDLVLHLTQ